MPMARSGSVVAYVRASRAGTSIGHHRLQRVADFRIAGRISGMRDDFNEEDPWDASLAKTLPGQMVLVGLAYFDVDAEDPFEQQQLFGRVVDADERKGILLSLEGQRAGEQFNLPPDTRSFREAAPGEYRLRTTGEVLVNPDFTVTFSIQKQAKTQRDA